MRVLNLVTSEKSRFFQQQVAALADHGVESETLTVPGNPNYEDDEKRTIVDYARFYPDVLRASFGDYDLVHANFGLTAPHALLQPNLPVVVSLWGTDLMGQFGWLSKRCARHADAVVVMSTEMAGALDCPCYVIPHGVDLDRFHPMDQSEARADLGWDQDTRYVLFPYPAKRGVKDYPRAERIVEAARERVDAPIELAAVTGVPHARMAVYMNAADALLLTSKREGSPNAVKESLACGLPVVATDVGDVRERLRNVTPATVSDEDDELVDGLEDVLRDPTRSNGREAARELSVEQTSARLHGVYEAVLDS
jgi:glycosyltransferase involved in cell wall biosynthesis